MGGPDPANLRLGIESYNAGLFAKAVRYFRRAAAFEEPGPQAKCFLAHALLNSKRPREAIDGFASLIRESPRYLPAYSGLAAAVVQGGRSPTALKTLRRALRFKPEDRRSRRDLVQVWGTCAKAFQSSGRLDWSQSALRRALRFEPRARGLRRELAELLACRGQALFYEGRLEPAGRLGRQALGLDAGNVSALMLRGQACLAAGRFDAAERALRRALKTEPDNARALRLCGQAYQSAGRLEEAAEQYVRLLETAPGDVNAHMALSAIAESTGKARAAAALLAKAVRLDRGEIGSRERFSALMRLGRCREAIRLAEGRLDAGPSRAELQAFADPWDAAPWDLDERLMRRMRLSKLRLVERAMGRRGEGLPWLHFYRGHLNLGLEHFDRLAAFPLKRYGWMYYKAGAAALFLGRFDKAVPWLESAVRHRPVDWRAHGFLAEANLCLRRPAAAHEEMRRALRAAPKSDAGQVLAWWGAMDLWRGNYRRALRRLDRAVKKGAQWAFCWKAAALLKLGRTRRALDLLDFTLSHYPRDPEARLWRGEAKRELGLYREALQDLDVDTALGIWASINRALVKLGLNDSAGMASDFAALPSSLVEYVKAKIGLGSQAAVGLKEMEAILRSALRLSHGYRREIYGHPIWMD
ncbi:MAG: tetratricopeptide repeat protein [Elusimicrobia bacterium]|nr:tetratricopeptide repeat protein [Elusimicrobiota bacterium]